MGKVATVDGLTEQQRKFAESFAAGMNQTQAARAAGYSPHAKGEELMRNPRVLKAIEAARAQYEELANISRKDVLDGLKEAIDMAKIMSDPLGMIAGWREIGKVCGHYEPTKKKVDISINGHVALTQLEQMPDHELARLIEGEVIEVIEEEGD